MNGWWMAGVALVMLGLMGFGLLRSARRSRSASQIMVPATKQAVTPRGYSPQNVGNDASARPWEQSTLEKDRQSGPSLSSPSFSGVPGQQSAPEDFEASAFLQSAKGQFIELQSAWDRADVSTLRTMLTGSMLEQIQTQLEQRENGGRNATPSDVVMLDAQLLGIEPSEQGWTAHVEFSGLIREEASAGPSPFRELWDVSRDRQGDGVWRVAGVQALQ